MQHTPASSNIQKICQKKGVSLTKKRQQIFDIVLGSPQPLSAYDIVEKYKSTYQQAIPAMSVYRILDFLTTAKLVHKLESVNQYTACSHLECQHEHKNAQFLICEVCHSAEEIAIDDKTHQLLVDGVKQAGFKLNKLQFELHGICQSCTKQ